MSESDLAFLHNEKRRPAISSKKKIAKFSKLELYEGLKLYAEFKEILVSQKGNRETGLRKRNLWQKIADRMSAVSGITRTAQQAKDKISSLRSKYKGPESERLFRIQLTGGGSPPLTEDEAKSSQNDSQPDLNHEIKTLAVSTLTKEQLVGFGGVDICRGAGFQAAKNRIAKLTENNHKKAMYNQAKEFKIIAKTEGPLKYLKEFGPKLIDLCNML